MTKQTKVGALVAVSLVIFGVTVFLLGRQEHLWERKVDYRLFFARTNGLQTGAPVSLSGLPIGSVDWLHFSGDPGTNRIEVGIRVDADAASRIRSDTKATIRTLGLLGDKYIELVPGTQADATPVAPGGIVASSDPTDYESMFGQSGDIVTNVVEVSTALKDVLQTIQRGEGLLGAMLQNKEFGKTTLQDLQSTLVNIRGTTQKLDHIIDRVDRGEGVMGRLMRDSKESHDIMTGLTKSVQSLERLTNRLEHGHGAAIRLVEDERYGDRVLGELSRTVTNLAEVTDKLNRGDGTLGKLVNDPSLYHETHGLVREVRSSWLVNLYEAFHGLWPSRTADPAPPEQTP